MTTLAKLQQKIQRMETAAHCAHGETLPTGCEYLNPLLPGKGYLRGTIVEWLRRTEGSGATLFSLKDALQAASDGRALVIADPQRRLNPPALAALGANLTNTIVLRCGADSAELSDLCLNDLYWAINQSLQCPGVAAVWADLKQIDPQWSRRFQLSAESSGCMGFFVRPDWTRHDPSWSHARWLIQSVAGPATNERAGLSQLLSSQQRNFHIELVRCRGGAAGRKLTLSVNSSGTIRPVQERHDDNKQFCDNKQHRDNNRNQVKTNSLPAVSPSERTKNHPSATGT